MFGFGSRHAQCCDYEDCDCAVPPKKYCQYTEHGLQICDEKITKTRGKHGRYVESIHCSYHACHTWLNADQTSLCTNIPSPGRKRCNRHTCKVDGCTAKRDLESSPFCDAHREWRCISKGCQVGRLRNSSYCHDHSQCCEANYCSVDDCPDGRITKNDAWSPFCIKHTCHDRYCLEQTENKNKFCSTYHYLLNKSVPPQETAREQKTNRSPIPRAPSPQPSVLDDVLDGIYDRLAKCERNDQEQRKEMRKEASRRQTMEDKLLAQMERIERFMTEPPKKRHRCAPSGSRRRGSEDSEHSSTAVDSAPESDNTLPRRFARLRPEAGARRGGRGKFVDLDSD